MNNFAAHPASFKDPAGFVFKVEETYYRQVNKFGAADYDLFISSGLYDKLVSKKKIISHTEVDTIQGDASEHYKTLLPQQLSFITYAYEWSFDQLKDAALLTLQIQQEALQQGMTLKDATPFNIAFENSRPIFIDTLSFEKYQDGEPWVAYKQFCESFLAPLLLMQYRNTALNKLLLLYPNGIPVILAADLLPAKTKFNLNLYLHIHLQARFQRKTSGTGSSKKNTISKTQQLNIISSLTALVKKISLQKTKTVWNNYYTETILSNDYFTAKQKLVNQLLQPISFKTVADLGANKGEFSILLSNKAEKIIAADFDADCINELYLHLKANKLKNIYPLVIDLTNPSPAIGWANQERNSFWERLNADVILALALIHHLAISFNINFEMLAATLSSKCHFLVIEFVPKDDPKVQQLLSYRKDVFPNYTVDNFEKSFSLYFLIQTRIQIPGTNRQLYLLKSLNNHA